MFKGVAAIGLMAVDDILTPIPAHLAGGRMRSHQVGRGSLTEQIFRTAQTFWTGRISRTVLHSVRYRHRKGSEEPDWQSEWCRRR